MRLRLHCKRWHNKQVQNIVRYCSLVLAFVTLLPSGVHAGPDEFDSWLGAGARVRPAYEGADSSRVDLIPYVRIYRPHLFARTTQGMLEGGLRTQASGALVFGAQLAYEDGRSADESAFLQSLGFADIDPGASFGLHVETDWTIGPMPWNALLRYRKQVDSDLGENIDLRVTTGIFSRGGFDMGLFAQLTWSDDDAMQSHFGVTPAQSTNSGLPVHTASAGMRHFTYGLLGAVRLNERWSVLWGIHAQALQGDARDAPMTLRDNNIYTNAGAAYRF